MQYRTLGRLGWQVSEIGYGMWGIAGGPGGFTGADYQTAPACLDEAVELGCNFFDTAWAYGRGISEQMLGDLVRRHPDRQLYVATKIPPKNRLWPPDATDRLDDVFPPEHIREYTEHSLENLKLPSIDLLQLHVWEDRWATDERWQQALRELRDEGLIRAIGISVNRWEPANCLAALDTGLVDVIQVIYNIFDQAPEDELFPRAQQDGIGIIVRVPFDEGSLTGTITADTSWPAEDWRATYFGPENLQPTLERVDRLRADLPEDRSMAEHALRFILDNPAVSTVIPGMRSLRNVRQNLAVSEQAELPAELHEVLRKHRWDRVPGPWSG